MKYMPNNNNSDLNNISLDQNTNNTLEIQETNSNDTSTPTDVYFNIIEHTEEIAAKEVEIIKV